MSTWSFRATQLESLGFVTLVSDSFKMPTRRGGNVMIPQRDGRVFVPKKYDQRVMGLGLELVEATREDLEAKIDTVKLLMGSRGLGTLSETMTDLTVRNSEAEYTGDLNPTPVTPVSVKFLLEFTMPDPFFRSSTLFSDVTIIDADPKTYSIINPGTVDERNPTIVLTGPLNNPTITNLTNGVSLTYNGAITGGHFVTIETNANGEFIAVDDLAANVIGNISHAGDSALMVIDPGTNNLSVADSTHTTGTVTIEFYPPFL